MLFIYATFQIPYRKLNFNILNRTPLPQIIVTRVFGRCNFTKQFPILYPIMCIIFRYLNFF